jgi:nicotinamidase-related amidase
MNTSSYTYHHFQDGSLAVANGRDIAQLVNLLVSLPGFVIKIATQDFHPPSHVSFATNHPPPNNKPFESFIDMKNWVAGKESEAVKQKLWPVHCVQGTKGAEFVDEFDHNMVDLVVQKGMDERSEMYSVFADAFRNFNCAGTGVSHDMIEVLKARQVSDVFIVGIAGDFCVKHTALDAVKAGFAAYVVEEGTKCVDPDQGWRDTGEEFKHSGVEVIHADGPELDNVKKMPAALP